MMKYRRYNNKRKRLYESRRQTGNVRPFRLVNEEWKKDVITYIEDQLVEAFPRSAGMNVRRTGKKVVSFTTYTRSDIEVQGTFRIFPYEPAKDSFEISLQMNHPMRRNVKENFVFEDDESPIDAIEEAFQFLVNELQYDTDIQLL